MPSKHYRWQTRWTLDKASGRAVHESGLVVRFTPSPTAERPPGADFEPAPEILATLQKKHGPHNMPAMLARLLREAIELHQGSRAGHP